MTQRQIARLACKVLAIYALIEAIGSMRWSLQSVRGAISAIQYYGNWNDMWSASVSFVSPGLQIALAIWLWKRAGVVAAWICGHDLQDDESEPDALPVRADIDAWQAVVISTMGVWIMISVAPQIVAQALNFAIAWIMAKSPADQAADVVSWQIWIWLTQFAIGLWLICGNAGIVKMLRRFRPSPSALKQSNQTP